MLHAARLEANARQHGAPRASTPCVFRLDDGMTRRTTFLRLHSSRTWPPSLVCSRRNQRLEDGSKRCQGCSDGDICSPRRSDAVVRRGPARCNTSNTLPRSPLQWMTCICMTNPTREQSDSGTAVSVAAQRPGRLRWCGAGATGADPPAHFRGITAF